MTPTYLNASEKDRAKQLKKVTTSLRNLTTSVTTFLTELDRLMKQPSTVERGRAVAKLSNELELCNDNARHFVLGVNCRTDTKS